MDKIKTHQVLTVRIEKNMYQEFRRLAFNENKKMNTYIQEFVKSLVENHPKQA